MSLSMRLMINDRQIGYLYARRHSPVHPSGNDVCRYEWRVNIDGRTFSNLDDELLEHRYGDGAWTLAARVLERAGFAGQPLAEGASEVKVIASNLGIEVEP